jgi:hypothetical protein
MQLELLGDESNLTALRLKKLRLFDSPHVPFIAYPFG